MYGSSSQTNFIFKGKYLHVSFRHVLKSVQTKVITVHNTVCIWNTFKLSGIKVSSRLSINTLACCVIELRLVFSCKIVYFWRCMWTCIKTFLIAIKLWSPQYIKLSILLGLSMGVCHLRTPSDNSTKILTLRFLYSINKYLRCAQFLFAITKSCEEKLNNMISYEVIHSGSEWLLAIKTAEVLAHPTTLTSLAVYSLQIFIKLPTTQIKRNYISIC